MVPKPRTSPPFSSLTAFIRYKGEHTLFRELVQNADDAGASCVVIQIQFQNKNNSNIEPAQTQTEQQQASQNNNLANQNITRSGTISVSF